MRKVDVEIFAWLCRQIQHFDHAILTSERWAQKNNNNNKKQNKTYAFQ